MPGFITRDETTIFYKDWGTGQPVVFSHGWPLDGDAWDAQMMHLAAKGFRVIAHDRRGHGRSSQTWTGNDMATYADDLIQLIEHLDLHDSMLVGHSTGGGEVALVAAHFGTSRVSKVVLVSAVTPSMVRSTNNPEGIPIEVFDGIRAAVMKDRSQFYRDFTTMFFGANRDGSTVTQGMRDSFWLQGMAGSIQGQYECIKAFSETDFSDALRALKMPVLIIHGDDDQVVPLEITARRAAGLVSNVTLKIYPGAAHATPNTEAARLNADLVDFARL